MSVYIVRSKERIKISHDELADFIGHNQCVLDVGAGDGKGSFRFARENPDNIVIALDSSFDALERTSKSASRKQEKGGAPNLLCLYANIAESSDVLKNCADHIRIYLPWGDLLEGIANVSRSIVGAITACGKNNASVEIVINAEIWRSNLPKTYEHLGEISPEFFVQNKDAFAELGLEINEAHFMENREIENLDTTWQAKLMSSRQSAAFVKATGAVKKKGH